jgi:hypothetical protein
MQRQGPSIQETWARVIVGDGNLQKRSGNGRTWCASCGAGTVHCKLSTSSTRGRQGPATYTRSLKTVSSDIAHTLPKREHATHQVKPLLPNTTTYLLRGA